MWTLSLVASLTFQHHTALGSLEPTMCEAGQLQGEVTSAGSLLQKKKTHLSFHGKLREQPFSQDGDPPFSQDYGMHCEGEEGIKAKWAEYKSFHEQCRKDRKCLERALIWKCGQEHIGECGGLGDNLKGIAFALYAAIASKRPFFISWNRLGQDVVTWFEQESIDVKVPDEIGDCPQWKLQCQQCRPGAIDAHVYEINTTNTCTNLVSNCVPRVREPWTNLFPEMNSIEQMYAVGCAIRFLFKPLQLTPADKVQFPQLPVDFSVIHVRTPDDNFGEDDTACANYVQDIRNALQCAKNKNMSDVVFLSPSEACKSKALAMQGEMGVRVSVSTGVAKHIDQDGSQVSADEFRAALWSEFVLMAYGQFIITNDGITGLSGFPYCAASLGFLPADRYLHGQTCEANVLPPCGSVKDLLCAFASI
jgi:hypothetical protein